jgi:hypothetical protein
VMNRRKFGGGVTGMDGNLDGRIGNEKGRAQGRSAESCLHAVISKEFNEAFAFERYPCRMRPIA